MTPSPDTQDMRERREVLLYARDVLAWNPDVWLVKTAQRLARALLAAETQIEERDKQIEGLREALAETKKRLAGFYNPYGETDANRHRYPHAPTIRSVVSIIDAALSPSTASEAEHIDPYIGREG